MRTRWTALAAALAACSQTPAPQSAGYRGPSAVVSFMGYTDSRPGTLWPYLAVVNARGDDLRIVDPGTDQVLNSPGHAFPLSVPVMPGPRYLASASLRDGESDLLAVAGVGSEVQIVATWQEEIRVEVSYDLSGLAGPGSEILSLAAAPYPGAPAGSPPVATAVPGRALLLAGFSASSAPGDQGKLVIVEFERAPDGKSIRAVASAVNPLGFDPVSLSVSPDGLHIHAATPHRIRDFTTWPPAPGAREVSGAAEIDMGAGPPGSWPVRGLDALAPTKLVFSALLGERVDRDWFVKDQPLNDQYGPPAPRVYAVLDPSGCGRDAPIECGIAVLDPALGGLPPDPAPPGPRVPAQPYRTPIVVPAEPLTMAVAMPAVAGETQCVSGCIENNPDGKAPEPTPQPLMRLAPSSGQRWTTAGAMVGTADGNAYMLDLGRYQAVNDGFMLTADETRLQAGLASAVVPGVEGGAKARLALYQQYGATKGLTIEPDRLAESIMVTPGFTRTEQWRLTWQGVLPFLGRTDFGDDQNQRCVLGVDGNGDLYMALQAAVGTAWIPGPSVGDPSLGIHAADAWPQEGGDVAQWLQADLDRDGDIDEDPCPLDPPGFHDARIDSILAPDTQDYPGGALRLVVPPDPEPDPFQLRCLRDAAALAPAPLVGFCAVRASGLVLVGRQTGYAGRPPLLTADDVTSNARLELKRYDLAWSDESALSGEALLLARKARRWYYPYDRPCRGGANCYGSYPELTDPLQAGPVLGFIAGAQCLPVDPQPATDPPFPCPTERLGDLLRGSSVVFTTNSGLTFSLRRPIPISLPSGSVALDKSQFPASQVLGAAVYLTYQLDALLMTPLGQAVNQTTTLR